MQFFGHSPCKNSPSWFIDFLNFTTFASPPCLFQSPWLLERCPKVIPVGILEEFHSHLQMKLRVQNYHKRPLLLIYLVFFNFSFGIQHQFQHSTACWNDMMYVLIRAEFFKKCLSIPTGISPKKQLIFANLWFLIHRCNFILGYKATFGLHPEKADSEKNFCRHDQPRFCHYFMIFNKFAV